MASAHGETFLRVAQLVPCTEAEGPGRRFALWFQGCPLRCPGCCNPEMLPFEGGTPLSIDEVVGQLRQTEGLEGITLLNSPSWTIHLIYCQDVLVHGVNMTGVQSQDCCGVVIDSSKSVRVTTPAKRP